MIKASNLLTAGLTGKLLLIVVKLYSFLPICQQVVVQETSVSSLHGFACAGT